MMTWQVEYRFYQWLLKPAKEEERGRIFARLHARHAPEVLDAIYELRGFYIKIGQVIYRPLYRRTTLPSSSL